MVKKGEYLEWAAKLADVWDDSNISDTTKTTYTTELSIIIEAVLKIKDLEERIKKLEEVK